MLYLGQQNRAILSANKIRRFLHDTRQIFVRRFCWQIKSVDFVVRLTSSLLLHYITVAAVARTTTTATTTPGPAHVPVL